MANDHDEADVPIAAPDRESPEDLEGPETILSGDVVHPVSGDVQSGERDYVAVNGGGVSAERTNPLPEEEQGRGSSYDPVSQGPRHEG